MIPPPKPSTSGLGRGASRSLAGCFLAVCAAFLLSHCSSSSPGSSQVVVSVAEQKLGCYREGKLVKSFKISTSKFGLGDSPGSYRTPLGQHEVIAKIGHGLPPGAVLKSRHWNGEVLRPNAPGRDPIVSRILWLRGLERSNRNAFNRMIYIHGTTEESRIGTPASYGCIRMKSRDVIDLFNTVPVGARVMITSKKLPHGGQEQASLAAESIPLPQPPAAEPASPAARPDAGPPSVAMRKSSR